MKNRIIHVSGPNINKRTVLGTIKPSWLQFTKFKNKTTKLKKKTRINSWGDFTNLQNMLTKSVEKECKLGNVHASAALKLACWSSVFKFYQILKLVTTFQRQYWQTSKSNITSTFTLLHLKRNQHYSLEFVITL